MKIVQSYSPMDRSAASTGPRSVGGASSIVGASITFAPIAESCRDRSLACCRVRVTTTVWPNSGRLSNQFMVGRNDTTRPMIVIAGGPSLASAIFCGRSAIVPTTVRCFGWVPQRIVAAGISGGMP